MWSGYGSEIEMCKLAFKMRGCINSLLDAIHCHTFYPHVLFRTAIRYGQGLCNMRVSPDSLLLFV